LSPRWVSLRVSAPSALILIGPGTQSWDIGLHERFAIKEHHYVQFRGEFFNSLNNVNFGLPTANVTSPAYGTIGSAGSSREIQFGLKYLF